MILKCDRAVLARVRVTLLLLAGVGVTACDRAVEQRADAAQGRYNVVDASASDPSIEWDPSSPTMVSAAVPPQVYGLDTTRFRSLRSTEAVANDLFTGAITVALLADGSLAAANMHTGSLSLYEESGFHAWTVGMESLGTTFRPGPMSLAPFGPDSLLLVDYYSRRYARIGREGPSGGTRFTAALIAPKMPFRVAGALTDGSLIALVGSAKDVAEGNLFRRIHDVARIDSVGSVSVIVHGVRGAWELPPKELGQPVRGGRAAQAMQYPTKARYFEHVVAAATRIFVLRDNTQLDVYDASGARTGTVSLPAWPERFGVQRDTAFGAAEVIALGFMADLSGNLWLEQPSDSDSQWAKWLVISPEGHVRRAVLVPRTCRVRAVALDELVCQHSEAGASAQRRISLRVYALAPR